MPPGINAGKVDINKMCQLCGIEQSQLLILRVSAMIEIQDYQIQNKDLSIQQVTQKICGLKYNPNSFTDCINAVIHYNIMVESNKNLEEIDKCLLQ